MSDFVVEKLTVPVIKSLALPKSGKRIYNEKDERCFGVRVNAGGKKTFVVRLPDKDSWIGIADIRRMHPDDARKKAREWLINGRPDERKKNFVSESNPKINDFMLIYWERHVLDSEEGNKPRTIEKKKEIMPYILDRLGNKRLSEVCRNDVKEMKEEYKNFRSKAASNAMLVFVKNMLNKALEWDEFSLEANVAGLIKPFYQPTRDRWLDEDEMRAWFKAVDEEWEVYRAFYYTVALTGCRPGTGTTKLDLSLLGGEARFMRWSEIQGNRWTVKDTKNGTDMTYHLTPKVLELINALPKKNDWVFAGKAKNGNPVSGFSKSHGRVKEKAGIENFHIHDLRRCYASYLINSGVPLDMVANSMNHKSIETTRIYAKIAKHTVQQNAEMVNEIYDKILSGENVLRKNFHLPENFSNDFNDILEGNKKVLQNMTEFFENQKKAG